METGFPWGSAPSVDLSLWRADAIVLFDWLMSTDLNAVPITHPAQKQALADLLARLEEVGITESTEEEIAAPRKMWQGHGLGGAPIDQSSVTRAQGSMTQDIT
ncbi:hypothetical protein [Streptomyces sp. S063]|uniref:hypothetical protein n=1 Tax=Streptomyces sp. S063 TaxID=2005885 RepID=UPI0019D28548|nr:hypothetical protein [Streptomyces sp. S063]